MMRNGLKIFSKTTSVILALILRASLMFIDENIIDRPVCCESIMMFTAIIIDFEVRAVRLCSRHSVVFYPIIDGTVSNYDRRLLAICIRSDLPAAMTSCHCYVHMATGIVLMASSGISTT